MSQAIHHAEVDGVPVLFAHHPGPVRAGLIFRVGVADETLGRTGLTHLVEHLALHRQGLADYHFNGATKAAFTHMRQAGGGRIVYMSSVAGSLGGFGQASYAATKSAMVGLARTAALEGARYGITANVVAPGIIATEAFKMGNPKMNDRMVLRTAMRAPGEPEDVANTIVFLCSPEARYVTGQVLHVAGGIDLFTF